MRAPLESGGLDRPRAHADQKVIDLIDSLVPCIPLRSPSLAPRLAPEVERSSPDGPGHHSRCPQLDAAVGASGSSGGSRFRGAADHRGIEATILTSIHSLTGHSASFCNANNR